MAQDASKMYRSIVISIFIAGLLTAPTARAEEDIPRQILIFGRALSDQRTQIIHKQEEIIALRTQIEWNDFLYIENIIKSLTTIDICLYYMSELSAVYAVVAALGSDHWAKHLPRMLEQSKFTRGKLDMEYEAILLRSIQIIHPGALALVFGLKDNLKKIRQIIDDHIQWLERIEIRA
jgi:hypothetical protein